MLQKKRSLIICSLCENSQVQNFRVAKQIIGTNFHELQRCVALGSKLQGDYDEY